MNGSALFTHKRSLYTVIMKNGHYVQMHYSVHVRLSCQLVCQDKQLVTDNVHVTLVLQSLQCDAPCCKLSLRLQ